MSCNTSHSQQKFSIELAGQFHRVPLHAADTRDAEVFDFSQQVVQAVAELVEQGDDFIVREQRGLAAYR